MADENATPAADPQNPQTAPIVVNAQYTKDLSFEVPGAPAVFARMQENAPDIKINIQVNAQNISENMFEVELSVEANCTVGDDTGFILELIYAGLFTINVADEHRNPVLLIECPRLIFPFARNIIADTTRDGGFPPVMLGNVDFVQMYQQQLEAAQKAAGETAEA